MNTYARIPLSFSRGNGCYLETESGDKYLDLLAGVAVSALGHNHPVIKIAITKAMEKPLHVSNWMKIPEQEELGEKLSNLVKLPPSPPLSRGEFNANVSPLNKGGLGDFQNTFKSFFCNSGAEANETALKLARKKTGRKKYISFTGGFHGRTFATLSITPKKNVQEGFEPHLPVCEVLKFNNHDELKKIDEDTAGVIFECVQGEGGAIPANKEWIDTLVAQCKKTGTLIIVDEIQTGVGRTGTFFSFEQYGFEPDIITIAKGLGGGIPIGAMLAKEEVAEAFSPGTHGTTFGGNPFVCSVALAVVEKISQPEFLKQVQENSKYIFEKLNALQKKFPEKVKEVRGKGFLIGIEFFEDIAQKVFDELLERKILANVAKGNVLRMVPPLILSKDDIEEVCGELEEVLS